MISGLNRRYKLMSVALAFAPTAFPLAYRFVISKFDWFVFVRRKFRFELHQLHLTLSRDDVLSEMSMNQR
jgi:hypothetical protein